MGVPGNANALLLRSATAAASGGVSRSLRFSSGDSSYLSRTPASAGNRQAWTWAGWVKRSALSPAISNSIFTTNYSTSGALGGFDLRLLSDNTFNVFSYVSGATQIELTTTQVFRDTSAWYHIVVALDTTQATAANRCRLYVNGTQVTTFSTATYPSQNYAGVQVNSTDTHYVGCLNLNGTPQRFFDGYLADVHFIDGQALDPTSFGEFDATTGVWNPKAYTGSYGTNGFHLEFADNSAATATTLGKDTSGNGNNFTPSNLSVSSTPNAIQFPSGVSSVDYLVVGGGGGAGGDLSGGGGGGGVLASSTSITSSSLYQVIVGAGGSGNTGNTAGSNGGDSRFGSIVAYGGGGGGGDNGVPTTGGSGGGGSTGGSNSSARTGAAGTSGQGYAGGNGFGYPGGPGGGGGAGGAGSNGTTSTGGGGNGGIGATSSITGTSTYYGGGGGGAGDTRLSGGAGTGGQGGGGNGAFTSGGAGSNGTANTGGGGGGGSQFGGDGGNGGSGVVVIRYADTNPDLSFIGSSLTYTKTTSGGYKIYSFTASSSVLSDPGNDSVVDVPSSSGTDTGAGGEVRGNYCTWNPLDTFGPTFANGNLDASYNTTSWKGYRSTIAPTSGKWYWEVTVNTLSGSNFTNIGVSKAIGAGGVAINSDFDNTAETAGYNSTGVKVSSTYGGGSYGASFTAGDVIGVGLDVDAGTLVFYKNGTSQGTAYSNLTANAAWTPAMSMYGNVAISVNFGQRPFAYQTAGTNRPASTYKALCTANLPAPVVTKPSTVFDTKLYTGNGSGRSITGFGFSPDLVWTKQRSGSATAHSLHDIVRGTNKHLASNSTDAEVDVGQYGGGVTAFNSDGFSLGTWGAVNENNQTYVAWAFDGGSTTSSNTQGSITSSVRANATAGFSIVTYTGTGATGGSVGHGLGVAPGLIIVKNRDRSIVWVCYHSALGAGSYLFLNTTDAKANESSYWGSGVTSTVFGVQANNASGINYLNEKHVAYCFAPVSGYSSFGSYTGNGSSDGPFVFTGHRSRWIMVKRTDTTGNWVIIDTARDTYNYIDKALYADSSQSESSVGAGPYCDVLSNGFKVRTSAYGNWNANGGTYVYASFAESPFNYSRAR